MPVVWKKYPAILFFLVTEEEFKNIKLKLIIKIISKCNFRDILVQCSCIVFDVVAKGCI